MSSLARIDSHAITGVVAPQQAEAMIREVWTTIAANPGVATLARKLIQSVFLAPLGWLVITPFFAKRLLGFLPGLHALTVRYTLTNRRLMVRRGMKPVPAQEIALNQIGDVRLKTDANSAFYLTGDLEVVNKAGQVAFVMAGVAEPESFRQSILQAATAWGPLLAAPGA